MKSIQLPILLLIILASCNDDPVPRPRAYFRLTMPEKQYTHFDTTFPYSFEYPAYATVRTDMGANSEPYWINIDMPGFQARLHISYKEIDGNLGEYLDDTYKMVMKHIPKSTGIDQEQLASPERRVYGTIYDIKGSGAASPLQFYCTDSTRHFLRGALYFNQVPNNDSLAPVIAFIREDVVHVFESLSWELP
jgi:gliding motility-associated lipoprotein GldD